MKLIAKLLLVLVLTCFNGCVSVQVPYGIFQVPDSTINVRDLQSEVYSEGNEEKVMSACAGALQDLGFNIEESETELGLIVASKTRTAMNKNAFAGAFALDLCIAVMAGYSGSGYSGSSLHRQVDDVQRLKGSVIVSKRVAKEGYIVRVNFQRIVWNVAGEISKMETLNAPKLYHGFFEYITKALFLEEHDL